MNPHERIHIPFSAALSMVWNYFKDKTSEQIRAVAFIIIYLVGFKIVVLNKLPANALQLSLGVAMVVFGLTFFLEGLFLGLMPLGERVGTQLPQRCHLLTITVFGVLLGISATLAEPAIASLRLAGSAVTPWETPLLFKLLELVPDQLLMAVGLGVGVAVAFGMLRFYAGFSIKPYIYVMVPLLLIISAVFAYDQNLVNILNLAWDTGGVTTGPVTVPLVLALGIGVSRSTGKQSGTASGFGIIALASLFPVLGVLILGATLNSSTPQPMPEKEFFAQKNRSMALKLAISQENLEAIAFQRGNEEGRRAFYADDDRYNEALCSLLDNDQVKKLLGRLSLRDWLTQRASSEERALIAQAFAGRLTDNKVAKQNVKKVIKEESFQAIRAVLPLVLLLVAVLIILLRDRPKKSDEVILGVIFSIFGMLLLTSGIRLGLAPLGDQVGRPLPQVFRSETHEEGRIILEHFDTNSVINSFSHDGTVDRFFFMQDRSGTPQPVRFEPSRYDEKTQRYEHIVERPPLFGPELTLIGILLVFLFAFGMGFGSTVAEPALSALGKTVEELTVGTIKRKGVINSVSLGVGIGLLVGIARLLYAIPTTWLIIPAYFIVFVLTLFSEDDFAGIAWDSGGVTTGPITVPLVLAMGLGVGGELNVVDGFGIVAMASVFPIMTMLIYGIIVRMHQRQVLHEAGERTDEN